MGGTGREALLIYVPTKPQSPMKVNSEIRSQHLAHVALFSQKAMGTVSKPMPEAKPDHATSTKDFLRELKSLIFRARQSRRRLGLA